MKRIRLHKHEIYALRDYNYVVVVRRVPPGIDDPPLSKLGEIGEVVVADTIRGINDELVDLHVRIVHKSVKRIGDRTIGEIYGSNVRASREGQWQYYHPDTWVTMDVIEQER